MKTQASAWANALWNGKEPLISDLADLVFDLSSLAYRLENLGDDKDEDGLNIDTKKETCLTLLTLSLLQNGLNYLEDIEATPLELVSGIHKVPFCGCHLTITMVGVLFSMKKYLSLACVYPGINPVVGMLRVMLE